MIGSVELPAPGRAFLEESLGFYGVDVDRTRGWVGLSGEPEFSDLIVHEDQVDRLEVCDRDPRFIATSGRANKVFVWNLARHRTGIKGYASKDRLAAHGSEMQ